MLHENLFLQFYKVDWIFIFNFGCTNVSNGSELLLSENLIEIKTRILCECVCDIENVCSLTESSKREREREREREIKCVCEK